MLSSHRPHFAPAWRALALAPLLLFARGAQSQQLDIHFQGFVYNDFNGNGILDPNENPTTNPAAKLPSPYGTIELVDPHGQLLALANGNGADGYSDVIDYFSDTTGLWTLQAYSLPPGYHFTSPANGKYTFDPSQTPTVYVNFGVSNQPTSVPEPSLCALLAASGVAGTSLLLRRRRK